MNETTISLDEWLQQQLADPEFRQEYEALEPAHQIARLRILRGLTQQELAERVGTQQPSIARLESGKRKLSLAMLERIAAALGADLQVTLKPR
jgi:predicted transcriptional regulator